jgi:hypothetical protein
MRKMLLLKKISAIHAIKCNKSNEFNLAIMSFNTLNDLKEKINKIDLNKEDNEIDSLIQNYSDELPSVSENDIHIFMNGYRN